MTNLQQVAYSWRQAPSGLSFGPVAATLSPAELRRWYERVEPWLRTDPNGSSEPSHFYGVFGDDAVLVRRVQPDHMRSAKAWLLTGPATTLTPKLALELREWGWLRAQGTRLGPLSPSMLGPYRLGLGMDARRPETVARLIPLLSQILGSAGLPIVLPPSGFTYSLLWGLQEVLCNLAAHHRPVPEYERMSFETYDDRARPPSHPGLFVQFKKGAAELSAHQNFETTARRILADYAGKAAIPLPAASVPAAAAGGGPGPGPGPRSSGLRQSGQQARRTSPGAPMPPTAPKRLATAASNGAGKQVICPHCLTPLSWDSPTLYRYDTVKREWLELAVPSTASANHRAAALRTAFVRCADPTEPGQFHYLPLAYGNNGPPAVYGFVGATRSGKTHLLTAMIGQIEKHGLGPGLRYQPINLAAHKTLIEEQVSPFLNRSQVIEQTRSGTVGLVDTYLISEGDREGRPVALFDVAGGDLLEIEFARRFLEVADGLIFVVNAAELGRDELGDQTFNTVLELLQGSGRLANVSAAIVLNKADLLRFDDPIALWMRHPDRLIDADHSLRESADIHAYLHARGAQAWTRPYRECQKATLHAVSAAGSGAVVDKTFVRGVDPCRVLNPLISLMAMTGVITSPEAQKIGI